MKALLIGGGGTLGEYAALGQFAPGCCRAMGTDENLAKVFSARTDDCLSVR